MIKISSVVSNILQGSETQMEAMRSGVLNLRAYARQIHPLVEGVTFKPVKIGTIVVALSRLRDSIDNIESIHPNITLEELNIKSPLTDITYEKSAEAVRLAHSFSQQLEELNGHFFTMTQGIDEITFIVSGDLKKKLISHFTTKPKAIFEELVGVNVRFSEEYLKHPNVIYSILSRLAAKRINVIEIVSTYTELMIVVEKEEMEGAIAQLNTLFKNN